MTGPRRAAAAATLVLLLVISLVWWRTSRPHAPDLAGAPPPGARALVATLRSEPATFNRYSGVAFPTHLVSLLTQAPLVRINRITQALEPWLADRWSRSEDGLQYDLHVRPGVRFSDGVPLTAGDVEFSFRAAYDPSAASPFLEALRIGGKPLDVKALGSDTVRITFPAPYAPGLRMLDNLPIYPAHLLRSALEARSFAKAWGPTTSPGEMAGLGPFVLDSYEPGQRLVFVRNPHFWRAGPDGSRLPRLDRLTIQIVPDQNAELLRLQAGQVDLLQSELRPEDYLPMKREADAGRVRLIDVGRSYDAHLLWFNLRPSADRRRAWLRRDEFRLALSHAVDRAQFARAVYLGAAEPAWGPITAANTDWYDDTAPRAAFDPGRATALLAGLGLRDRNDDRVLDDSAGAPVRFAVLIQKGNTPSEKGAAVLRERWAAVGVAMDVVAMDLGTMTRRWAQGDYDAIYHLLSPTDTDPAGNMDFWLSSGGMHMWNPGQPQPATEWERRIDSLMLTQVSSLDVAERKRIFGEVQHLMAEHAPALAFATPHVYIATSARVVANDTAVQRPQVLWSADTLAVVDR